MTLTKEMLHAYQNRWQILTDHHKQEVRQMSMVERWQQLNALRRMAAELGLQPDPTDGQAELVYERWNKIKTLYLQSLNHAPISATPNCANSQPATTH